MRRTRPCERTGRKVFRTTLSSVNRKFRTVSHDRPPLFLTVQRRWARACESRREGIPSPFTRPLRRRSMRCSSSEGRRCNPEVSERRCGIIEPSQAERVLSACGFPSSTAGLRPQRSRHSGGGHCRFVHALLA
ncbi:hypothetical protein MRX96_032241 [Rhipicephalus microplus]